MEYKKPETRLQIVRALKARIRTFKQEEASEKKKAARYAHKSRRVRLAQPHSGRANFYLDKYQELEHLVSFLEGKCSRRQYIHHALDDEFGAMLKGIGNLMSGGG
jgi:hypothetical protein